MRGLGVAAVLVACGGTRASAPPAPDPLPGTTVVARLAPPADASVSQPDASAAAVAHDAAPACANSALRSVDPATFAGTSVTKFQRRRAAGAVDRWLVRKLSSYRSGMDRVTKDASFKVVTYTKGRLIAVFASNDRNCCGETVGVLVLDRRYRVVAHAFMPHLRGAKGAANSSIGNVGMGDVNRDGNDELWFEWKSFNHRMPSWTYLVAFSLPTLTFQVRFQSAHSTLTGAGCRTRVRTADIDCDGTLDLRAAGCRKRAWRWNAKTASWR